MENNSRSLNVSISSRDVEWLLTERDPALQVIFVTHAGRWRKIYAASFAVMVIS